MEVKFRKGFPTKRSITEVIDQFWGNTFDKPRMTGSWEFGHTLIWDRNNVNERINEFAVFLNDIGIQTGRSQLRQSPRVGSLEILKK